ncbi:tetratricopeptide repeat protein [Actinoplanes sp. CA-142083]|uniref:tetratricopeptide repeat protein n=1 Tax=Actinoplanes sp. CA-142083 TaxID=3239903 RepID=UPI003D8B1004
MNASSASMSLLDEALTLLRAGRVADAEELMKRAVRRAAEEHGEGSAAWATAQSDMGNVLLRAQQPAWAAECFRAAVSAPPGEDPQRHLGYRLNLGIALALSGRLDEAAEALRESREGRLAHFGREHLGYAAGLEPLADVLLRLGDFAGALEAIDEAVPIFQGAGHPRVASAVALRGVILQADGRTGPLFPALKNLPDEQVERVAAIAVARVQRDIDPAAAYMLVAHLANALRERLGPDHAATVSTFGALSQQAGERGDHNGRVAALRRVLAAYDRQDLAEEAVSAATDLARALSAAGETDKSLDTYEDAAARAERIGRAEGISQALFDWGLALQDAGRAEPAAERFGAALAAARRGDDRVLLGHVGAAYGICLQHLGRLAEARAALEECLTVMDPRDEAASAARGHLVALLDGEDCDCARARAALEEAYRDFVVSRTPDGLLARFDVRVVANNFMVDVEFQRQPAEDEVDRLNQVLQAGHAEFIRQVAG